MFDLSELQCDYILELRLRRLTRFSIIELETEAETLRKEIADLQQLLSSDELVKRLVSKELNEVAEEFGDARRTQLINSEGVTVSRKPVQVAQLEDSPAIVTLDALGKPFPHRAFITFSFRFRQFYHHFASERRRPSDLQGASN